MARKQYFHEDHLPEDERELRRQFLISVNADPAHWTTYDLNDPETMRTFCEWVRHRVTAEQLTAQFHWWYAERENLKIKRKQAAIDRVKRAAIEGTELALSPNDIAEAKLYARTRAFALMPQAIDTLEEIMSDTDAKGSERIKAAETILVRAIGPAEVPNSIPFAEGLKDLSPTEVIDAVTEGVATGACSEILRQDDSWIAGFESTGD